MTKISKHKSIHYLSLVLVLSIGALLFALFPHNEAVQFSATLSVAVGYVVWGVIHHHIHRDLTIFIAIEYISIALLGLVLLYPLIL